MTEDICSKCGNLKRVAQRDPTLCFNCYNKENKEICINCNKLQVVNTRDEEGNPICQECNRKRDICSCCNKFRVIKFTSNGAKLCGNCRSKDRKENCSICGKLKIVIARNDKEPLCGECYKKLNKEICCVCGKLKSIKARKNGPTCEACHKGSKIGICNVCKEEKPLNNTIDGFKVCVVCYHKSRTAVCAGCNKIKQISTKNLEGEGYWCYKCYKDYRMKTDIEYKIKNLLRGRFKEAINRYFLTNQIEKNLASKYINFKLCFESLGKPPDDGEEYHIDHIFPISAFDFSDDIEIKIAWVPENLRWLKAKENLQKRAKYDPEELLKFKIKIREKYNF